MTPKFVQNLLDEFHVDNEDELQQVLSDVDTIPCIECECDTDIDELRFDHGDPVCDNCRPIWTLN